MPDDNNETLDQLVESFTGYLTREAANREDWIEIQVGKCLTLVAMRDQFPADVTFGKWFEPLFGEKMNKDTCWRAIAMGRQPEELRECLMNTRRESLHHIYENDFNSRYGHVSEPRTEYTSPADKQTRQGKAAKLRLDIEAYVKGFGDEGTTGPAIDAAFGLVRSNHPTDLRANGIIVPTGERRKTGKGGYTSEVLVHRDFAPARKPAKKPRGPKIPLNRFSIPLVPTPVWTEEELKYGRPADDAPPAEHMAFLRKYGHAPGSVRQRDLMMASQQAARLAPQLRDLGKALKAINPALSKFLRTPQEQRDDIVPMPADEFVKAALEIRDGAHIRGKVERTLDDITVDFILFNQHVKIISAYITELKLALVAAPRTATEAEMENPVLREGLAECRKIEARTKDEINQLHAEIENVISFPQASAL